MQQKGDNAEKNGNTNSPFYFWVHYIPFHGYILFLNNFVGRKMSKQPPAEWPNTFTIPTRFSVATTSTMKSGGKARDEIEFTV